MRHYKFNEKVAKEIIQAYLNKNISGVSLAEEYKCSLSAIYDLLRRKNVKLKGTTFFNKGKNSPLKNKTFEEYYGYKIAEEIKSKMKGRKLSEENKQKLRTPKSPQGKLNIKLASLKAFKEGRRINHFGKESPNWKDGLSFEPHTSEFNKPLKNQIRERDKECIICKIAEEYAKKQIDIQDIELWQKVVLKSNLENKKKIALHIHHIDYNKKNNQQENLIALCINHHLQTNANRNKWQNILQEIMKIKLNKIKQLNLAGAR